MAITVNHSTPADGTFSAAGALAWDANHTLSGLGTMAEQNANAVAITGGTISGVILGDYIPYTGATSAVDLNAQTLVNIAHLGIGTATVPTILLRAVGDNNSTSRIALRGYSSNANSSAIRVTKFRGTTAAPQAPQSGDSLGKFELAGYGTTSSDGYPQASFEGVATENWGATARGTKILFYVTPNTTITQAVALTIDQDSKATFAGALSVTGHTTFEGVTSTGATGTGKLVYDTSPTFVTPLLGTPTSGNFSTGTFTWPTFNQNTTGSAAKWTTARTESLTGDITGSTSVDGSANYSIATTLATVNSNVGTFTKITVNGKGLATAASQASLTDLSSPTASFSMGSQLLTSVLDPVSAQDAATKNYVDTVAQGLDAKASVVCATTANITLSGTQTIDGIAVAAGNRVLVKNQTLSQNNGIYVANASTWTRSTDMDTWAEVPNSFVFVETGTTQADTGWVCTADAGGTLGTTPITWTQFSGAGTYTAGTGLTLTGTQFSITNAGTAGTYGSATQSPVFVTNAQGQVTSVTNTTITPAVGSITGLGTGVATFLATPTSANLATAVTDETGSGALVFATSPTLVTPLLGTPTSGNFSTGTFTWPTFNQNTSGTAAGLSVTLVATSGGTGQSTYAVGDLLVGGATNTLAKLADVATGNSLISGGVGVAPSWGKIGLTTHVSGTLPVANGGTNLTTYAVGDIVYASGTGTLASLADVATGNAIISGGVGVAPSYGKIGLTTHVSGTLPIANGGTNGTATPTAGAVPYGTGTAFGFTAAGTSGQVLTSAGAGTPTWTTPTTGTVTSVTGTAPVVSSGGATPAISMAAATTSVNGYLTSTDWNTFNSKGSGTVTSVAALTLGTTGTDLSSSVATGTTTPVITLNVPTASATNRGALSAADWSTFNSKQPAGTYVTSVTGTAPVVSSGGTTPAISMAAATTSVSGYLTNTDWTTFNGKYSVGGALGTPSSATLTNATGLPIGGISATGTPSILTFLRGDGAWATPAGGGTVTSVAATVPAFLSISGSPIVTSGTLAISYSGTALPVANGGTGVTTSTGSVNTVLSTSPTLTTPIISTTLGVGGATPSASGAGITFPATASLSTNANTLDDYKEGTYTPTVTATSGTFTTVSATGRYVKIGNQVTVNVTITITSVGSASGRIKYTLPYTPTANYYTGAALELSAAGIVGATFATDTGASIVKYDYTGVVIGTNYVWSATVTYFVS
jgi:hypothetical protein